MLRKFLRANFVQTAVGALLLTGNCWAQEVSSNAEIESAEIESEGSGYLSDYTAAYKQAKDEGKTLILWFAEDGDVPSTQAYFEKWTLHDKRVQPYVAKAVLARVGVDTVSSVTGKRLVEDPAFADLKGSSGIVVISFKKDSKSYGKPISVHRFRKGEKDDGYVRAWDTKQFVRLLSMPDGTPAARLAKLKFYQDSDRLVPNPHNVPVSTEEYRAVLATNSERVRRGLRPLILANGLMQGCRQHAGWMRGRGNLQHASGVNENIAMGNSSPEATVGQWMGSSGHRAAILNGGYRFIGVSGSGIWWCQRFN